jgi:hypothetical protein
VPVGVTGHRTQRPRGQVGPPRPHPAQPSSSLDPGGERRPISPPLAPLIAQLVLSAVRRAARQKGHAPPHTHTRAHPQSFAFFFRSKIDRATVLRRSDHTFWRQSEVDVGVVIMINDVAAGARSSKLCAEFAVVPVQRTLMDSNRNLRIFPTEVHQ